jgi:iron complex outermembrane receptor protein
MMKRPMRWAMCVVGAWCVAPTALRGQTSETPQLPDSTKPHTLAPVIVSITRIERPLAKIPLSIQSVDRDEISRARPTWGLDEALVTVPGVFVANRYNFSQDQRISIRGFGARSAFAVRGIKILLDGIPQTLPDGQGQLTNLELGEVERIEVLRGSASALFGNASGGVISMWTRPPAIESVHQTARFVGGSFGERSGRTWNKWQSTTAMRVGDGTAQMTLSRLDYEGERDHSAADQRVLNARLRVPFAGGWSLMLLTDAADNPRADNPGSLTLAELQANRDTVPALNRNRNAGKDVTQTQSGATLHRTMTNGGEATVTVFGLTRDLKNPITTTYIDLDRVAYGARSSVTYPLPLGSLAHRLTAGFDFQRQRDDRENYNYMNTPGDSATRDTVRSLSQLEYVTEFGPFVQSALELSPRTTIVAGLRYDWVKFAVRDRLIVGTNPDDSGERLMRALSGSLGIAVNPSRSLTVYGNVGSSFETPTTTELANSPSGAGGFNTGLKPQHAWNFELGARGSLDRRFTYSLALFQAEVRDALIPYEIAAPRFFYRNAGSARHQGLEVGGDLSVVPGLTMGATWTYSDYRFREYSFTDIAGTHVLDGRPLAGIPDNWLHLTLRAQPAAFAGGWAEVQPTYSSGYLVSDVANTRTSPWWSTNVRAGWDGEAGSMRLAPFIGINNAFNKQYVSSVVINAARGRYYEPAPGRNVYLGMSIGAGR